MLALLLGGCASAMDQTNGDLNSPVGGTLRIADQLRAQGDNEGATAFYARAVQRAPNDIEARRKFADALEARNDQANAAAQYKVLIDLEPGNAEDRDAYGRVLLKLNHPADARAQYEAALAEQPHDTRALNGLGVALDLLNDHAGAQNCYKAALDENADDPAIMNNLGHSYVMSGNYDQAVGVLEPLAQNPAAPRTVRDNLAEAYAMAGMDVDAERILKADLPSEQAKKKLAGYQAMRKKISGPRLYVDLGNFSTPNLAASHIDGVRQQFAAETAALMFDVVPEVDEEGGTPTFHAQASGFEKLAVAKTFCDRLKKSGAFCKAHGE